MQTSCVPGLFLFFFIITRVVFWQKIGSIHKLQCADKFKSGNLCITILYTFCTKIKYVVILYLLYIFI